MFTKIDKADYSGKGVIGLPDAPQLSTTAMQEKFEEISTDVIIPKFNNLVDELEGISGASNIGTTNGNVQSEIDAFDGKIATFNGDISQLKSDMTQAQGDIATLQSGVNTNKTDIAALQSDNTANKADIASLKSDNVTLKGKAHVHTNKSVIDALSKDSATGNLMFEGNPISGGGSGNADTYGHVKVGSVTIDASGDDTIELVAGSNVTLTPNATNKSVTISASGGGGGTVDAYTKSETDDLLSRKVDKVNGKGLSTNDYSTEEKQKLGGIEDGANKTTVDSALSSTSTNPVQNKVITAKLSKLNSDGTLDFSNVESKPTTLSGYGITDAYTKSNTYSKTEVDNKLDSWHKYNGSIEENTVNTTNTDETITFHSIDTSKAYELWFDTSDGQQATVKSSLISGTDITYTVNTPTAGTKFRLLVKGI